MCQKLCLIMLLAILLGSQAYAMVYCKIQGRVIDDETGEGIPDVNVNLHLFFHDSPEEFYVMSDKDGYFTFGNIVPGKYSLHYNPLYPYAAPEYNDKLDSEKAFTLKEGQVKQVVARLQKGAELIVYVQSSVFNFSEYFTHNVFFDRIEDGSFREVTWVTSFRNPKNVRMIGASKFTAVKPGEFILCASYRRMDKYTDEPNVDVAGIVKFITLEKLEIKEMTINYDSKAKLIFNISGENNLKWHWGSITIYRKVQISDKDYYYCVFDNSYSKKDILKPIIIEPGEYFVRICCGDLINSNNDIFGFDSNYFFINIRPDEEKSIDFKINLKENMSLEELDSMRFIHY